MILTGSVLLSSFKKKSRPIPDGGVVIRRGLIVETGSSKELIRKYPQHKAYSLENAVLMPGLVNAHAHLELPSLLKRIRTGTLPHWVIKLVRAKKRITQKEYVERSKKNILSLIRTGTTTVAEICTHGASLGPLHQSGLRGVIFFEVISMTPSMRFFRPSFQRFRRSALIQTGISPHAPYTVSADILKFFKRKYPNQHYCMHVAESEDELKLLRGEKTGFQKVYKMAGWDINWAPKAISPFLYLYELGLLSRRFIAVHAVHTTIYDIRLIKKTGASVVHCPRSNKETHVGMMPLKRFLDAGITVGLGTDSLASSPSLSLWDEIRFASRLHERSGVSAAAVLNLATRGGARALGLDAVIGTLAPGKRADIIAVPVPSRNTGNIYSDLIRETKSSIMTMVNGKILRGPSPTNDNVNR
jgi:cytosine/adenosine deaminase-related metal-dependent hydrolase